MTPFTAAARWLVKFLLVCCCACGAADGTAADLKNFDEGVRTLAQGCSWRGGPTDEYDPREPERCYNVVAWEHTRLTDHQLASPCDASDEPSTVLVRPDHPQLWGYYDRDQVDGFKVLRYELLDSCP